MEVDAASSARRIDEMREWLETVRYAPVASRYRITIMDEAHQIQDQAASALLKTLEEPPPHLVVILCTTQPWDILGTIRSRLQHYVLRKPGIPALTRVLDRVARAEGIEAGEQALDILARAADGSYRDALGLLDQISTYAGGRVEVSDALELIGAVSRESVFELVDLMAGGDAAGAFELLQSTLDGPVDSEQAIRGLVAHLRGTSACCSRAPARATSGPSRRRRSPASRPRPTSSPRPRSCTGWTCSPTPRCASATAAPTRGCSSSWWRRASAGRPSTRPPPRSRPASRRWRRRPWPRRPLRPPRPPPLPRPSRRRRSRRPTGRCPPTSSTRSAWSQVLDALERDAPPRAASSTARGRPRSTSGGWSWR